MRAPVRRASSMSRWTISSSASAGQPGRPSSLQQRPSCITAPPVRRATSQCWASTMSRPSEYSIARRISSGSCTPLPSSVKMPHAGVDELGERRQRLPRPAHRDAAGRQHLAQAGRLALAAHELDDATRVLRRVGVRHRHDGREAAERGGPAARSRSSRPPPGPARAGGRGGRRSPGATTQPAASSTSSASPSVVADGGDAVRRRSSTSARRSPVLVDDACRP